MAVGGKTIQDQREFLLIEGVQEIIKITSSYKLVSRLFQHEDTVIKVRNAEIGGEKLAIIAGPCAVESVEQLESVNA